MTSDPARPTADPPAVACPWGLRVYAAIVLAATFFLILSGGQVTSTDSGDAVPTWPLPIRLEMTGGVFYELGHRQVAATVGLLTAGLVAGVAIFRRRLAPGALRGGLIALGLVLVQAGLGGLRVLTATHLETNEEAVVVASGVAHTFLGQLFLAWMACWTLYLWRGRALAGPPPRSEAESAALIRLRGAVYRAVAALFLQLVLGAILRLTRPGPVAMLVLIHIGGAGVVIAAVADVVFRVLREHRERRAAVVPMRAIKLLLSAQIVLGFAAYFAVKDAVGPAAPEVSWRTVLPTLHLAVGAALLALTAVLAFSTRLATRLAAAAGAAAPRVEVEAAGGVPASGRASP